jgi:hypothetical protein
MAAPAMESVQCFGRKKTAFGWRLAEAHPPPWTTPFRWRRHAHPRQGRRSLLPDLRHPSEHRRSKAVRRMYEWV